MNKTQKKIFKHIRFLGAEGIGMSALIRILEGQIQAGILDKDTQISKSDLAYSKNDPLSDDIDLVVRSTAIAETDSDYSELKSRELEIWHRSDMLNFLSKDYKQIVVSGTHGKTSCSAILSHILISAGLEPCFAVGGILKNYNSNGHFGSGEYFVLEGDESDKSFTKTNPYLALVTNIEPDHLENYPGGITEIKKCFFEFLDRAEIKIICVDNPLLAEYAATRHPERNSRHPERNSRHPERSEGSNAKSLARIDPLDPSASPQDDTSIITYSSTELKNYDLNFIMQGKHNQLNALGCLKAAQALGISEDTALKAIQSFTGIKRRFELVSENYSPPSLRAPKERGNLLAQTEVHNSGDCFANARNDIRVYDDYAHHPTEVAAVLEAVLSLNPKKLLFVYQPHHPERTQQFWNEFVEVFNEFPSQHICLIADIYVARSKHIDGVNSERMVQEINNPAVKYLAPLAHSKTSQGNIKDMTAALKPSIDAALTGCDYLFIVGAGDISKIVPAFQV